MQKLRSHIAKIFIIPLVCCGFGLCFMQPLQAKHKTDAFAHWLTTVTNHADYVRLARELSRLKDSKADLNKFIEQASLMISQDNGSLNLKLPEERADASHQIYQLLLMQWNQLQSGSGMASVPPPETMKPALSLQLDKFGSAGNLFIFSQLSNFGCFTCCGQITKPDLPGTSIRPMSGGIAIGAP